MSKRLREALAAKRLAEDAVAAALKEDYPVGAPIEWEMNEIGDVVSGVVVHHSYGDRIKVRNIKSAKTYWIHAYRIARVAA